MAEVQVLQEQKPAPYAQATPSLRMPKFVPDKLVRPCTVFLFLFALTLTLKLLRYSRTSITGFG